MQVTKEDRIFKSLALLSIFIGVFVNTTTIDVVYKLYVIVPLITVMLVLGVRKYLRDKAAGKPLVRYYVALGVMLLSVLMAFLMVFMIE